MTDFISLGSKITANDDCSHEIKTLVPWKKSNDKPIKEHIKEQKHHFAREGSYSETMIFPVGMYGCEIWTIKKAEH